MIKSVQVRFFPSRENVGEGRYEVEAALERRFIFPTKQQQHVFLGQLAKWSGDLVGFYVFLGPLFQGVSICKTGLEAIFKLLL